jgi:membrane protease YdiL (CAAX protease family)
MGDEEDRMAGTGDRAAAGPMAPEPMADGQATGLPPEPAAAPGTGQPAAPAPERENGPKAWLPGLAASGGKAGAPASPVLEAVLVFAAFWLGAYLPADPSAVGASLAKPLYHLAMIVEILPKALILLYLMHRSDGLAAFGGIGKPVRTDLPRALFGAAGALVMVSVFARLIAVYFGTTENPLLAATSSAAASPFLLLPAVCGTALSVGYAEELYFRIYLPKRLGQAGLGPGWAATGAVLLFASGHGLQGLRGMALALVIGGWFMWRRLRGAGLHELAWGHALYDAAVMLVSLYGFSGAVSG